jgi:hypothetical protein
MKRKLLIIAVLVASMLVLVGWQSGGQRRVQWEYKIVVVTDKDLTEADLNALGQEGWELIPIRTSGIGGKVYHYFKRQK